MAGKGSAAAVGRCGRYHHGNVPLRGGVKHGFGVEGVKAGFQQEAVHAAFHQACYLLPESRGEIVETVWTPSASVHIGGQAQGMRGGAHTAGHPNFAGRIIGRFPGYPGGFPGHGPGLLGTAVFGLGDGVGTEGIGLYYIGPGVYVCAVDAPDELRTGKVEHLRVAMPITLRRRLPLNHGSHGAVQKEDSASYLFPKFHKSRRAPPPDGG